MDKTGERKRIREIASVFMKYGVKEGLTDITNPVRIRKALEELGPTFVKIGQILSTRPDILPENYINEFGKLQDNVAPEEFSDICSIVEQELKAPIEGTFLSFEKEPAASASLAQVHKAVLKSGEVVVVKVQRPKVKETMLNDIAILKRLTLFMKLTPQGHVMNPKEVVGELMQSAKDELDFLNEAQNIKRFFENNNEIKYITCPKVFEEYTTSRVLTMEYIDGIKIADTERLEEEGYDLRDMGEKLAANYLKQIFEDGFFHADPHPGNILIRENKIAYIDFGMMGTIGKGMQDKFNSFLYGIATKDIDLMTQMVMRIGVKKGSVDTKRLYSDIEQIYNSYINEALYDIDIVRLMDEIFKVCRKNNISMPREITMLMRGMMTIEGVVAKIAPDMDVMDVAVPYIKHQMIKKRNYKQDVEEQLENLYILSKTGLKIPIKLLELINSALAGKLKVQMEHTNLENSVAELNKMVNRIVFGIIVASLIIASALIIRVDAGPKTFNISSVGLIGFVSTGILGLWLLISILRSGKM